MLDYGSDWHPDDDEDLGTCPSEKDGPMLVQFPNGLWLDIYSITAVDMESREIRTVNFSRGYGMPDWQKVLRVLRDNNVIGEDE